MQCFDILPWEARNSVLIETLQEIIKFENPSNINSLDQVVRVSRHLGLEPNSERVQLSEDGKYIERDDIRVAYDHYYSEFLINKKKSYLLSSPFLVVFLNAEYKDSPLYFKKDKIHQDPTSLTLRPADSELVNFLFRSQITAQVELIKDILKIEHRLYINREGLPQSTHEITNINGFVKQTKEKEGAIGYDESDPNATEYAIPGCKFELYSKDYGFSENADPLIKTLRKLRSAA